MTADSAPPTNGSDGLWRWLVGGLAAGAIILGLAIAAYAIGYHRGQDHARQAAPVTPPPSTTSAATTTSSTAAGPVQVTPALVAQGKTLFSADGCSACHSLTATAGVGPGLRGIAGSARTLADGQTVTVDDAYLERSISNPDAQIVKGYRAGIMPAAIASFGLGGKPDDIRALVAFIKSQK